MAKAKKEELEPVEEADQELQGVSDDDSKSGIIARLDRLEEALQKVAEKVSASTERLDLLKADYDRDRPAFQAGINQNDAEIADLRKQLESIAPVVETVQKLGAGVNEALNRGKTAISIAENAKEPGPSDKGVLFALTEGGQLLGLETNIKYAEAKDTAEDYGGPTFFTPFM